MTDNSIELEANKIKIGKCQFIAMSHPLLQSKPSSFWTMMFFENTSLCVNLTSAIEPFNYLPSEEGALYEMGGGMQIICDYKKSISIAIIERGLTLNFGGLEKKIVHLDFNGWKDMQIPTVDNFKLLLQTTKNHYEPQLLNNKDSHLTVHCMAGIGRTGTFITAYLANKDCKLNLYQTILDIRHQRPGKCMVETAEQYLFLNSISNSSCRAYI